MNAGGEVNGLISTSYNYIGSLPNSAKDDCLASWIQRKYKQTYVTAGVEVILEDASDRVNIGDIVSGSAKIKSVLDSLYPVLGGVSGAPLDWKIEYLRVARMVGNYRSEGLRIRVQSYQ